MNSDALAKDVEALKKDLYAIGVQIKDTQQELDTINRSRELARADLKNIQTMNDPLVQNYDLRITQKKKELVLLEADIVAALRTREDIDEAMAERLATGQSAIDNALKIERKTEGTIRDLKQKEESMLHVIENIKSEQAVQSSALAQLKHEAVVLEEKKEQLTTWLLSQQKLKELQDELEANRQELDKGRDYVAEWEKALKIYEHDLNVMEKRLKPDYIALYRSINSPYIDANEIKAHTRRIRIQVQS